jgi:hypothetical protein
LAQPLGFRRLKVFSLQPLAFSLFAFSALPFPAIEKTIYGGFLTRNVFIKCITYDEVLLLSQKID